MTIDDYHLIYLEIFFFFFFVFKNSSDAGLYNVKENWPYTLLRGPASSRSVVLKRFFARHKADGEL